MTALATTALPFPLFRRGKVRDVYDVGEERLLIVATDRVSAFDVVMGEVVPFKGAVLTQLTAWWLRRLESVVDHHMLSADAGEIARLVPSLEPHRELLRGRAMLSRRTEVFPVECVVRGYLAGSAWKEYRASGTLAGEALPAGLRESDRLTPPIFSPATKAESGHDENIPVARMASIVGAEAAAELERLARAVYDVGCRTAEPRGIIIADTKFEFGRVDGRIILVDEVLTPDSSRYWDADLYDTPSLGLAERTASFDKQIVRNWLAANWDKTGTPPTLPSEIVEQTALRYRELVERLTA